MTENERQTNLYALESALGVFDKTEIQRRKLPTPQTSAELRVFSMSRKGRQVSCHIKKFKSVVGETQGNDAAQFACCTVMSHEMQSRFKELKGVRLCC